MKYTTVLMDFDDTLIDTQGYAERCLQGIYKDYKIEDFFDSYDEFVSVYMKHTHELWDLYALGKIGKQVLINDRFYKPFEGIAGVTHEYLDKMNKDFMSRVVHIDAYIDGSKEILEYLKPKYKIVMLSNGFSELQYNKLDSVGFTHYFDEVVLSDAVGVNKPHPDIFKYALKSVEADAKNSIMIGDNLLADIKGAMNSNIDQIWFNPKNKETDEKPTYTISRLEEIADIL